MSRVINDSAKLYGCLLRLYPRSFRREFGPEMAHCFRQIVDNAYQQSGWRGLANVWFKIALDLLLSIPQQHWYSRQTQRRNLMNDQPQFPKLTILMSATILGIISIGLLGFGFFGLVVSQETSITRTPGNDVSWRATVYHEDTQFTVLRAQAPKDMRMRDCDALPVEQYTSIPANGLLAYEVKHIWDEGHGYVAVDELDLPLGVSMMNYRLYDDYQVRRYARYCYQIAAAATNTQPPLRIDFHASDWPTMGTISSTITHVASFLAGCLLLMLAVRLRAFGQQGMVLQFAPTTVMRL